MINKNDLLDNENWGDDTSMKGIKLELHENSDETYDVDEDREEYLKTLEANNVVIHEPKANEIFIDLDSDDDYDEFKERLEYLLERGADIVSYRTRPSSSGLPHRHVIVVFKHSLTTAEQILLQATLNSDPMREFLNARRYFCYERGRNNVLFSYADTQKDYEEIKFE